MRNSKMRNGVKEFYEYYRKCIFGIAKKNVKDVYFDYRHWFDTMGKDRSERIESLGTFNKYWSEMLGL